MRTCSWRVYVPYDLPLFFVSLFTIRYKRCPHNLNIGDRLEVRFNEVDVAAPNWYRGTVVGVRGGSSCAVEYDDGDVFRDYFDSRPGSVVFKKLNKDAPRRPSGDPDLSSDSPNM